MEADLCGGTKCQYGINDLDFENEVIMLRLGNFSLWTIRLQDYFIPISESSKQAPFVHGQFFPGPFIP